MPGPQLNNGLGNDASRCQRLKRGKVGPYQRRDRPRPDDRAIPDADAGQDEGLVPDPNVMADADGATIGKG